jgi:WXG100 family type VII secretion target
MTTMLRVQPDTLDALSARLGALRTHDLETIQRELRAITRALDASWESVAASDFRHAYGHWLDGYHRRCAELAAVERFLRAVAVGYRETEARLIGAVDSSDRGASKVLARSVAQGPAPRRSPKRRPSGCLRCWRQTHRSRSITHSMAAMHGLS